MEAELKFYQRICLVVANEGLSGLSRRIIGKLSPRGMFGRPADSHRVDADELLIANAKKEYQELLEAFAKRSAKYGDLSRYYWYHTIDLGDGLLTPGDYDYRFSLPAFQFPEDMKGMTVLDVGSATGFFAFEFEKRGARVVSVELPSIADWDMPTGLDREQTLKELMIQHRVNTIDELHHVHLDGPFQFCHERLKSKVQRCYCTIYELSPQRLGIDAFDLVFVGDVLLHTFSPFRALSALAPLCRGKLIIAQTMPSVVEHLPAMIYVGGESRSQDCRSWFMPNELCFENMLKRLGFKSVTVVGKHKGVVRQEWFSYDRTIIHAVKA